MFPTPSTTPSPTPPWCIRTVAGTAGTASSTGDGGPWSSATLNQPHGVAVNPMTGDVYVAEKGGHVVRKFGANNVVSTLAGAAGSAGNATSTNRLSAPMGIAWSDDLNGVVVADSGSNRVAWTDLTGVITRLAGNGSDFQANFGGDPLDAAVPAPQWVLAAGSSLVTSTSAHTVVRVSEGTATLLIGTPGVSGFSGDGGHGIVALLSSPAGIFTTGNGEAVVDRGNCRVRQWVGRDNDVATIAGNGSCTHGTDGQMVITAALNDPVSAVLGNGGEVYITECAGKSAARAPRCAPHKPTFRLCVQGTRCVSCHRPALWTP